MSVACGDEPTENYYGALQFLSALQIILAFQLIVLEVLWLNTLMFWFSFSFMDKNCYKNKKEN